MTNDHAARTTTRVRVTDDGPVLVDGPVEVVMDDGSTVRSERRVVALCTCRRSRIAPFCDTSHRTKVRADREVTA
ncbi:CDGSH iron-sulfur domain-containing protein [Knoellia sp. CPCC 206435]|uniref:CDGSH iron-sulfur domain-containing protein n=1 Tax=Knoellia terrae TaxID=3404797 RepID=UPI003B42AF97